MSNPYAQNRSYVAPKNGNLNLIDIIVMLWREIWLMLAVASLISLLGIAFAMTMKKKYTAEASLSVVVGQEYVYDPAVNGSGGGQAPKQEEIVQSEVEVLTSAQLAQRVLTSIGVNRLYDAKAMQDPSNPNQSADAKMGSAVEAIRKDFSAFGSPNTTVIKLNLKNKDPNVAAEALNKWIDEYLVYRKQVLNENRAQSYGNETQGFSKELEITQKQLNDFLTQNQLSDYDADKLATLNQLAAARQELMNTVSRRNEAEGRFSASDASYSKEPRDIRLSFESDNSKRLLDLQQQLAEALTKYTEESQPVQDLRRKIDAVQGVLNSPEGQSSGTIRTGPNPVHDSLASDRARNNAEVYASKSREQTLQLQVKQLEARAQQIALLRPQYEDLMRKKAILEDQVKQFSARQLSAEAQARINAMSNDNVRVIERAIVPTKGSSPKMLIALGSILFGGLCGLTAGIIRAFSRNAFPTPSAASRKLGVPILATINR